ncbi:MAG: hypothetical protein FK731_08880 [Asgard group archaeon]|nr:hypothetical protein [Asgard group archaeon]
MIIISLYDTFENIDEYPSYRIERLVEELRNDIIDIIEYGYAPSNKFNEHLLELKFVARILSDQDL